MYVNIDSDKFTQFVPGIGLKLSKEIIILELLLSKIQNSGAFSTTRDILSTKFLEIFQNYRIS